jgi:hypothetical protein
MNDDTNQLMCCHFCTPLYKFNLTSWMVRIVDLCIDPILYEIGS